MKLSVGCLLGTVVCCFVLLSCTEKEQATPQKWQCEVTEPQGLATAPKAPFFVDVTAESGISLIDTNGFGRAQVVDLNGDGFDDIVATPAHDGQHNRGDYEKLVMLSNGDGTFRDATRELGFDSLGVGLLVFADVDNDGDQDAFAGSIAGDGRELGGIWLNGGNGRLEQLPYGVDVDDTILAAQVNCGDLKCTAEQITATFADFNGDGILDLYSGSWLWNDGESDLRYSPPGADRLFFGDGAGLFSEQTEALGDQRHRLSSTPEGLGRPAMGVAAGDYDNDGDIDVYVANYGAGRPVGPFADRVICEPPGYLEQNLLWRNDGDGTFTDVSESAGVAATMRGPLDIVDEPVLVMGEECDAGVRGTYQSPIGGNSFTPEMADFDNDGDLDIVVGSIAHPDYVQSDPTLLFINQGPPDYTFSEESLERGLVYREDEKHPGWFDVDNDGYLDLVATGFRNNAENHLRVYLGDADGQFTLQPLTTTGIDDNHQESAIWLDYDGDGDLDLYIAEDVGRGHLHRNDAADANHTLSIRLRGKSPADATGARITLTTSAGTQMREMRSGGGHYNPQRSRALSFGLGGDACATNVSIRWPDGTQTELGDIAAHQALRVSQNGDVEVVSEIK